MMDAKSSSPVHVSSESSTVLPSSLSDHCSTTASESFDEQQLFPWSLEEMKASLGEGPMRFAPNLAQKTTATTDTESCSSGSATNSSSSSSGRTSSTSRSCRSREKKLKTQWEASNPDVPFSYDMYLRLQNEKQAVAKSRGLVQTAAQDLYTPFGLSIEELEPQLLTETLFPVPGLRSSAGLEMFYMRPARYFPKRTPTEDIIDNLAYVMQSMAESEEACTNGIGFLAYMNGWKYEHFSVRYCNEFMAMLQQRGAAKVKLFLIVDPPTWFPAIWRIMKGMLSREFRKKVFMIREEALGGFLEEGFEQFLPDDMPRGKANTHELVKDFIAYRKFVEEAIGIDL